MMSIEKDLSSLTTLPVLSIQKIFSKFQDCLCYNIQQQLKVKKDYIELDISIGKLLLYVEKDSVLYKFIPSSSFEKDVKKTIISGESPLISKLETSINTKITDAYKELF